MFEFGVCKLLQAARMLLQTERTGVDDFVSPDGCRFACYGTGGFTSGWRGEEELIGTLVPMGYIAAAVRKLELVGDGCGVFAGAVVSGGYLGGVAIGACAVAFIIAAGPGDDIGGIALRLQEGVGVFIFIHLSGRNLAANDLAEQTILHRYQSFH